MISFKRWIKTNLSRKPFVFLSSWRKAGRGWSGSTPRPAHTPQEEGRGTRSRVTARIPDAPLPSFMRNEPVLPSLTQPMTKRHPAPQEVEPRGRKQGGKRSPTCYGSPRLFLIPSLPPRSKSAPPTQFSSPRPGKRRGSRRSEERSRSFIYMQPLYWLRLTTSGGRRGGGVVKVNFTDWLNSTTT